MARAIMLGAFGLICGLAGYSFSHLDVFARASTYGKLQLQDASETAVTFVPKRDQRYTYLAHIIRVVDGDTVDADIDLGFHTWRKVRLRLNRIDAPEQRGASKVDGMAATAWLKEAIEDKWLMVRTVEDRRGDDKRGSFRRYLIEIFRDGKNINDEIVSAGHAVYRSK